LQQNKSILTSFKKLEQLCISQQRKLNAGKHAGNSSSGNGVALHQIDPVLLSQFKSDSFLGKGTFGTVELHKFHGYCVPGKKFKSNYSSKQAVLREATIMSRLSHQNLPYLFGICTESTPYCIVSRFCGIEGESVTVHDALTKESSATLPWFIYLFIVLRFQTSYNNCIKEAGTPQQLNTNYSGPFTKYQYKYRNRKN
jgi:hypothetical protein